MTDLAIVPTPQNTIALARPKILTEQEVRSVWALAEMACRSGMSKAKTVADAFFIIGYGLELGIPQMTSLRTIYSVGGGAPTCSGEAMLSLLRRSGKVRISVPDPGKVTDSATVHIKRLDTLEEQSFTFTLSMATAAGLVKEGSNWKKYPHMMLIWRAVSMGAKLLCSDIIGGLYTVEELYPETPVDETGQPIGEIVIENPNPWTLPGVLDTLRGYAHAKLKDTAITDAELAKLAEVEDWTIEALSIKYPNKVNDALTAIVTAWNDFTQPPAPEAPASNPDNGEAEPEAAKSGLGAGDAESGHVDQPGNGANPPKRSRKASSLDALPDEPEGATS